MDPKCKIRCPRCSNPYKRSAERYFYLRMSQFKMLRMYYLTIKNNNNWHNATKLFNLTIQSLMYEDELVLVSDQAKLRCNKPHANDPLLVFFFYHY